MTETDCLKYTDKNCRYYPNCKCMGIDREVKYPFQDKPLCNDCPERLECASFGCLREDPKVSERCSYCNTPDTCNRGGCVLSYNDPELALSDQCIDCLTPNKCFDEGCVQDACCGDPQDCNEACNVVYPDLDGRNEACNVVYPDLDGRNEGPKNRHGCSYVDCDCIVPCTSKATTIINITNMSGDINF